MTRERCCNCGDTLFVYAIVDSEDWERIAQGDYALCPRCMARRFDRLGLRVECDLYFSAAGMGSVKTRRVAAAASWRPRDLAALGPVGLPSLYASGAVR